MAVVQKQLRPELRSDLWNGCHMVHLRLMKGWWGCSSQVSILGMRPWQFRVCRKHTLSIEITPKLPVPSCLQFFQQPDDKPKGSFHVKVEMIIHLEIQFTKCSIIALPNFRGTIYRERVPCLDYRTVLSLTTNKDTVLLKTHPQAHDF